MKPYKLFIPFLFGAIACSPSEPKKQEPGHFHMMAEYKGVQRSQLNYDQDGDGMIDEAVLVDTSMSFAIVRESDILRHWIAPGYESIIPNYDPEKVEEMNPFMRNNLSADYRMLFQ